MTENNMPCNVLRREKSIDEFLIENRMPYFYYTITMRAIPYWFDGLKPSHRRILYSLYESNVTHEAKRIKGKKADGLAGSYNPHGSLYKAITRLARKDTCMLPLLDPKGNMGLHNAKFINESADRYTSFRLSEYATDMFKNIKKGLVKYVDNYDGSLKEPVHLLPEIPNVLVNPNIGVANGFATRICSYNIGDVCDQTYNAMLKKHVETMVPDFASKGYIINDEKIFENIMEFGSGSLRLRAKYHIEGNDIVVTELPYLSKIEDVETKILSLMKSNKLKEVSDVSNYTDKKGLRLTITCKRNVDKDDLMIKLYKLTKLESNFPTNMTVLYNNRPVRMGTRDIINNWVNKKIELEKLAFTKNLSKIKNELQILYGFRGISNNITKTMDIITSSENEKQAIHKLSKTFNLTDVQSKYICSIRAINLNKDFVEKQIARIGNLEDKVRKIKHVLDNEDDLRKLLADRILKFKEKYNHERYCKVINTLDHQVKKESELLIEDYNCQIQISKSSYLKKTRLTGLNVSNNKLKDGDEILTQIQCTNKDEILLFGEDLNVYKYKVYELEETKLTNLGHYMYSDIKQNIIGLGVISDIYKYVLIVYRNGNIAKIKMDSYKTKQNRQCLSNSLWSTDIFGIYMLKDDCDINITVSDDRIKTINTSELTLNKARNSSGKKIITWKNVDIKEIEIDYTK